MRHTLSLAAIALLCSAPAFAQTPAAPSTTGTPSQTLSLNPFGLLLEWYNVEFERKIASGVSIGASAAGLHDEFWDVDLLARYYPQGDALRGFYLGARGGVVGLELTRYEYQAPPPGVPPGRGVPVYPIARRETRLVPAAGLEVGYNWLLGSKKNIAIGLGFGLSRLLDDDNGDYYMPVIPHWRVVNVGIAF
jgi:hypothetical protein